MSRMTRGRLVRVSSALTFAAAVALMLATMASATSPIVHRVSVGTPDACLDLAGTHPGCDGNFSLTAIKRADGSVSGQYTDRFARGDGFHAVVDCLVVDGNQAWVSGVITQGRFTDPETGEETDLSGFYVFTRVQDNGRSANDPPDQISFSFFDTEPIPCTEMFDVDLLDAPDGQVTVT
jgi:hypothetical protein